MRRRSSREQTSEGQECNFTRPHQAFLYSNATEALKFSLKVCFGTQREVHVERRNTSKLHHLLVPKNHLNMCMHWRSFFFSVFRAATIEATDEHMLPREMHQQQTVRAVLRTLLFSPFCLCHSPVYAATNLRSTARRRLNWSSLSFCLISFTTSNCQLEMTTLLCLFECSKYDLRREEHSSDSWDSANRLFLSLKPTQRSIKCLSDVQCREASSSFNESAMARFGDLVENKIPSKCRPRRSEKSKSCQSQSQY